jgi:hypothetical protein
MNLTNGQVAILKSLAEKPKVVYGGAQGPDITTLLKAGLVKETPVNISESLYELTDAGRDAIG